MPTYFYHLKFELYPTPTPTPTPHPEPASTAPTKHIWLPDPTADIFASTWPSHARNFEAKSVHTHTPTKSFFNPSVKGSSGASTGLVQRESVVIDCGPATAKQPSPALLPPAAGSPTGLESGLPLEPSLGDQDAAIRDWRFGAVSVEGVDMESRSAGQSSAASGVEVGNGAGGNGGGSGVGGEGVGGVTKARFQELKNTEVGWGVVHLYRDGEEAGEEVVGGGAGGLGTGAGEQDYTTLCVPAVPSFFSPSDFMSWVGPETRDQVSHFRMVMTGDVNRYLVLMKFRDSRDAKKWRETWDGKLFFELEPETCHVMFIKSIIFQTPTSSRPNTSFPEISHDPFTPSTSASNFLKPLPPTTNNLIELPTCPVCLERMDDTTGLLTIPCQHVFHCACLQKWRGTGCPVCRHTNRSLATSSSPPTSTFSYDPTAPPFGSGEASLCSICDCADDLWICLICGNVGCGRYKGGHAKEHWKDSAHNFALEIETQHVWDYAGDVWVHRLIRDKGDSKLIELPSSSSRRLNNGGLSSAENGNVGAGHDDEMEMVPREKLDRIGMEYTHLLTSQLESQRVYFEELVARAVAKASAASSAAATANARADSALVALTELKVEHARLRDEVVVGLEKELEREKKKAEKSSDVARGFGKSLMEEKKVSEGLMERIGHVNAGMMALSKELSQVKEENAELAEANRDLLFSITAQGKLREMQGEGDLEEGEVEGGVVSLPPEKERRRKGKGKK